MRKRQAIGIPLLAVIASTTIIYLRVTWPGIERPVELTLIKAPGEIFGKAEEPPSLTLTLACQEAVDLLEIRFIPLIEERRNDEGYSQNLGGMGEKLDDPEDLARRPPLGNIPGQVTKLSRYSHEITYEDGAGIEKQSTMYTLAFHMRTEIPETPFLTYAYVLDANHTVIGFYKGVEDFFIDPEYTLRSVTIEQGHNITRFSSEGGTEARPLADRPKAGTVKLQDLRPGDIVAITITWKPNIESAPTEIKTRFSPKGRVVEEIEVTADGEPVDLGLDPIIIENLGI